jgi:hypothetical protein
VIDPKSPAALIIAQLEFKAEFWRNQTSLPSTAVYAALKEVADAIKKAAEKQSPESVTANNEVQPTEGVCK